MCALDRAIACVVGCTSRGLRRNDHRKRIGELDGWFAYEGHDPFLFHVIRNAAINAPHRLPTPTARGTNIHRWACANRHGMAPDATARTDAASVGIRVSFSLASVLLRPGSRRRGRVVVDLRRTRQVRPSATGVCLHVGCVCRRGSIPDGCVERESELGPRRWRLGRIWRVIARASSRARWNGEGRCWRARRKVHGAVRGVRREGNGAWRRG